MPVPSSYQLAERYGLTRRVVRYELERLRNEGVLIAKPRVGMFTNPAKNFLSVTPVQREMSLIGMIDGDGSRFVYYAAEARMMGWFAIALSDGGYSSHYLHFHTTDDLQRVRELVNLKIDGVLWRIFNYHYPSGDFLRQLLAAGVPVVVVSDRVYPGVPQVLLSRDEAMDKLQQLLPSPRRLVTVTHSAQFHMAEGMIQRWGLSDDAVCAVRFQNGYKDGVRQLRQIVAEQQPDVVLCDTIYAEAMPQMCRDLQLQCEIVTDNEVNVGGSLSPFPGWSVVPRAEEAARAAVKLFGVSSAGAPVVVQSRLMRGGQIL